MIFFSSLSYRISFNDISISLSSLFYLCVLALWVCDLLGSLSVCSTEWIVVFIRIETVKTNSFSSQLVISITNCSFYIDHEWPLPKASWPQKLKDFRCGLHILVHRQIPRSTSFHYTSYQIESKYGTVNSITLNMLVVCLDFYYLLCYPWIQLNF